MKRICVYCGSKSGVGNRYLKAAAELGKSLVRNNIELVYGGASIGLMGKIADSVIDYGGKVIGVIPQDLFQNEVEHLKITELIRVANMHERKATMAELSDGFIALPGGYGTMEEVLEAITWRQLNIYNKPIGLLNCDGYYDSLIQFINLANTQGFIKDRHLCLFTSDQNPDVLLEKLQTKLE